MGAQEAMAQRRVVEEARTQAREEAIKEFIADIARLTAEVGQRNSLLIEGFDLLNAVMLRSGLLFNLTEHGEIIAKVKAWNLRVRCAGVIKIASGKAG